MAMDDDLTPWCIECKLYHYHSEMVRKQNLAIEIKATIGRLLDSLVEEGHANHDLHPYANCQTCRDMEHAYNLLRRL